MPTRPPLDGQLMDWFLEAPRLALSARQRSFVDSMADTEPSDALDVLVESLFSLLVALGAPLPGSLDDLSKSKLPHSIEVVRQLQTWAYDKMMSSKQAAMADESLGADEPRRAATTTTTSSTDDERDYEIPAAAEFHTAEVPTAEVHAAEVHAAEVHAAEVPTAGTILSCVNDLKIIRTRLEKEVVVFQGHSQTLVNQINVLNRIQDSHNRLNAERDVAMYHMSRAAVGPAEPRVEAGGGRCTDIVIDGGKVTQTIKKVTKISTMNDILESAAKFQKTLDEVFAEVMPLASRLRQSVLAASYASGDAFNHLRDVSEWAIRRALPNKRRRVQLG